MIRCLDGEILIETAHGVIRPTAEEIFSVVHEGADSIQGTPLSGSNFEGLGIEFLPFAARAVVELTTSSEGLRPAIKIKVFAQDGNDRLPVPIVGQGFADYGCDGCKWLPLSIGSTAAISDALGAVSSEGTISLKQYIAATAQPNKTITILDRVHETLDNSRAYPAPEIPIPKDFSGTLYPYQATGFRWLSYMVEQGVPGCLLADEMGLGKTVQVICAFLSLRLKGMTAPALIIAPATLLENWRRELLKFAPKILPLIHRGPNRTGIAPHFQCQDVVVTSYETLLSDVSLFRGMQWGLMVIDEAQAIKNPEAKRTRAVKAVSREAAIAVTGTPVENRLTDLWSIADFLLPGRLGSLSEFQRSHPETEEGAVSLGPRVSPFILRRKVSEVATDLPSRIDIPQVVEFNQIAAEAYERIRLSVDPSAKGSALAVLQRLRAFCAHPWLTDELRSIPDPESCSPKLVRLREILEELFACGEKAIIFTSFHEMSDILTKIVGNTLGAQVWQIDGRTAVANRQTIVDTFSKSTDSAALVLNPRAAGTGLNIVAANHVIHYNLEWNPAVEDQASARSYRRGQTRPVTVHRLLYSPSIEEFIASRSSTKRVLAQSSVIGSDGTGLSATDIARALNISPLHAHD